MVNRQKKYFYFIIFLGAGVLLGHCLLAVTLPELEAVKTEKAPVIDGELQDEVWQKAALATGFIERKSKNLAKVQTKVYFLYDDGCLYLAFRCEEPSPSGMKTGSEKDKNERKIWSNDLIDVLIKPDENNKTYYQFALSPGGMKFDQKSCPQGQLYEEYSPDWETKTFIGKDFWQAEMKIPLKELGITPQMGKIWRMNFCRSRSQSKEVSSWSYTFSSWHDQKKFGLVKGVVIGADYQGMTLKDIRLGSNKVGSNIFTAKVVNLTSAKLELKGELTVKSPNGRAKNFPFKNLSLPVKSEASFEIPYKITAEEGKHIITLELFDNKNRAYYKSAQGIVDLEGLLDCYVERTYYTREKQAKIICLVSPSIDESVLKKAKLKCELLGTGIIKESGPPLAARTEMQLPLTEVKPGKYTVEMTISGENGAQIATQKITLLKLPPGKGSEVKVVRRDKGAYLLVNGKPFLLVTGFLMNPTVGGTDVLKEMAEAGFTTAHLWMKPYPSVEEILKILDAGKKYGIMIILYSARMYDGYFKLYKNKELNLLLDRPKKGTEDEPENVKKVRAKVKKLQDWMKKVKDHPALLYFFGLDEPGIDNMSQVKIFAEITREVDPYHPLELGTAPSGQEFQSEYASEVADIYSTHRYICLNRPIYTAYARANSGKAFTDRDRKFYLGTITSHISASLRGLTYPEQRCEAYLGLIGGWQGLRWFTIRHPYLECWENIKKVAGEIRKLEPVLLAEEVEQNLKVNQPKDKPILWKLFKHDGKYYVLAVNSKRRKIDSVIFSLPGLKDKTLVKVKFEDRELRSNGNTYTDQFNPFGVHVYEINE